MVDEHSRVDLVSILQRNYTRIKREIDPSWRLADELFQAEIIDERVYDNIKSSRDMAQRRADLLIKALAYDISSSKFHAFKATLRKCGYRYIADVLAGNNKNKDFNKYKDASQYQKYRSLQGKLNKLRDLLLQEFEPKLVIDELLEMEIISFIEHEDIWTAQSNEDRIDLVLKCVKKNVEINLGPFCSILQKHSQWLEKEIDLLQKEEESPSESDTRPVLKLFCKDGDWTFHPEGSFKNHPDMNIHIEFNTEKKQNVDVKVVERHKNSAKHVLDIPVSKLHLQFAELEKGSIVIRLQPLSSRALRKLKESKPEDIIAIVQSLLTNEDLQALKASKLTGIKIKIEASRTSLQAPVSMKEDGVTREAIVRNFSYLSESLGKVKEFIPAFLQDKHLPENSKENLKQLLILKSEDRNEAFLRFLLHEESGRSRILFQRQLCKMKQASILRILDNTDKEFKEALGKNEMQMNYSYLLDELEGREFLKAFAEKELFDDEICDKILRPRNRRERTKLFVDFLLSGKNDVRTFFFQELEAHHPAIYNVLFSTKLASQSSSESQSALSSMKAAICERFDEVIKEIEPKIYRDAFVERKIFTIQEYDELVKLSPRRERAAIFLTRLLHSNNVFAMKTFIWVLQRTGNQYLANNLENDFYMLDGEDVVAFPENECADECTLMTAILDARIVITGDKPGNSSENGSHLSECPNQSKDSESTPTDIYSPGKNPTEQRASDQKVISWLQSSVGKNEHIVQCTMTGDLSSDETPSSQSTSQALTEDVLSSHEEKVIDKVSDHDLTKEVASCTTSIKSSTQSCEEDVFGRKRHRRPVSAPLTKTKILKRCQHKESERKMLRRRNSAATHEALSAPVNSHIYYNNDCDSACMSVISPDFRGEDAYSERQSNDSLKSSSKIKNDQRDI